MVLMIYLHLHVIHCTTLWFFVVLSPWSWTQYYFSYTFHCSISGKVQWMHRCVKIFFSLNYSHSFLDAIKSNLFANHLSEFFDFVDPSPSNFLFFIELTFLCNFLFLVVLMLAHIFEMVDHQWIHLSTDYIFLLCLVYCNSVQLGEAALYHYQPLPTSDPHWWNLFLAHNTHLTLGWW